MALALGYACTSTVRGGSRPSVGSGGVAVCRSFSSSAPRRSFRSSRLASACSGPVTRQVSVLSSVDRECGCACFHRPAQVSPRCPEPLARPNERKGRDTSGPVVATGWVLASAFNGGSRIRARAGLHGDPKPAAASNMGCAAPFVSGSTQFLHKNRLAPICCLRLSPYVPS